MNPMNYVHFHSLRAKHSPHVFGVFLSQGYGSEGLKLMAFEEIVSFGQSVHKLTFDPGSPEDGFLTTECRLDHPFYVKNKGMDLMSRKKQC